MARPVNTAELHPDTGMTISFKQFNELMNLSEAEYMTVGEGLSDLPGFGWLKGKDNSAKLAKISAERAKLKGKRDEKSKAMDAEFAKIKAKLDAGGGKAGALSHDDLEQSLPSTDRKFHAKNDKMRDQNAAHVRKNLGIQEAEDKSGVDKITKRIAKDYDEPAFKLSPAIAKHLEGGSITADTEMGLSSDAVGDKSGKSYFDLDDTNKWQTDLHDCKWAVQMKQAGGLSQGLALHKSKPFAYLITTDGESGTWWVYKIKLAAAVAEGSDHKVAGMRSKVHVPSKEDDEKEAKRDKGPVTIQGRKGMKSTPFEKTFKSQAALDTWMEKNGDDVSIDRYSYPKVTEAKYNVFGIMVEGIVVEDEHDDGWAAAEKQNKLAKDLVKMLKTVDISAKLEYEADNETDASVKCGKAKNGDTVRVSVRQDGKFVISQEGKTIRYGKPMGGVGMVISAVAKALDAE